MCQTWWSNKVLDGANNDNAWADSNVNNDEKLREYVTWLTASHTTSIQEIHCVMDGMEDWPQILSIPMLDVEPSGIHRLKGMAEQLMLPWMKA
jgi:hypothetical protein